MGGSEAVGGLLGVQLGDDRDQPIRHFRDDLLDRPRLFLGDALEDRQRRGRTEGRPAAAHHVQHAAEAEQVGTLVDHFSLRLLRRHVQRRAGDGAALRQAGVIGGAGQTEVGDLHAIARLQQDVARLDVAVNQPARVRRRQSAGDLLADLHHLTQVERTGLVELLLKGQAVDVLHDEERDRLFLDGVNADDVLVANAGGRACLAQKALASRRGGGQLRSHHLDRDHALQPLIERLEHDAAAAAADDLLNLVMTQPAEGAGPG